MEGKHVLITGGSEGLGLELAKLSIARGAVVSILARTPSKLEAAKKELLEISADAQVVAVSADVGNRASLSAAVAKSEAQLGPVDICIAAAGSSIPKYFEDLSEEDFSRMMNVNYMGVVNLAHVVLPGMTKRDSGHFCAVSSMAAAIPFLGYAAYAPAKAACKSFLDVMRNEFADTHVQFHIACPPDMDTPGFANENETKPYETSHMFPECFNEVFSGPDVAKLLLDDLLAGRYFIRSPDYFGNVLVSRAWGHYPRKYPCLEACVAPLFVGIQSAMVWWTDGVVRKRAHHKSVQDEQSDNDEDES